MKIVAWIVLSAIILIVLALTYYLVVGAILFKMVFARKNIASKYLNKDLEKRIKNFKIDLDWWKRVEFERVEIQSMDSLRLVGRFREANSQKTAIVFHGFGGEYWEMQQYCKFFLEQNFNVLVVDMRCHGESQGNCIGYGLLEKDDVASWVKFVNEKRPNDKIVLFGLSMGAASVCMCSSMDLPNVQAIISDCAFASADAQFENVMRDHRFVLKLIKGHLYSYAKRVWNFDMMQANAVQEVKNAKVPILFIHGSDDKFVAFENLQILYDATPANKREKFVVEGAVHANSYPVAGAKYEKAVQDFLLRKTTIR